MAKPLCRINSRWLTPIQCPCSKRQKSLCRQRRRQRIVAWSRCLTDGKLSALGAIGGNEFSVNVARVQVIPNDQIIGFPKSNNGRNLCIYSTGYVNDWND